MQTISFQIDQWNHALEGAILSFAIKGGSSFHREALRPTRGEIVVHDVPVPQAHGGIEVSADLEDNTVSGKCALRPDKSGTIYIKIEPKSHDRIVTHQSTSGTSRQGNQFTLSGSASGSATGKVGVPLVAEGAVTATATVTGSNQFARHDTNISTQDSDQEPVPVVTGLILTQSGNYPQTTSDLSTSLPALG